MATERNLARGPKDLMSQIQKMQQEINQEQKQLADLTVEANPGGGAVKVVMSGAMESRMVEIGPHLLESGHLETVQDLMALTVNQGRHDSHALAADNLGPPPAWVLEA